MGTETTSAAYRRTQNPRVTKFFYGIMGSQRNQSRKLEINKTSQTQFILWMCFVPFQSFYKASRKALCRVGTNTWVSGMCRLHADTPTRLFSESAHSTQSFATKLRKTNKVPEHRSGISGTFFFIILQLLR